MSIPESPDCGNDLHQHSDLLLAPQLQNLSDHFFFQGIKNRVKKITALEKLLVTCSDALFFWLRQPLLLTLVSHREKMRWPSGGKREIIFRASSGRAGVKGMLPMRCPPLWRREEVPLITFPKRGRVTGFLQNQNYRIFTSGKIQPDNASKFNTRTLSRLRQVFVYSFQKLKNSK